MQFPSLTVDNNESYYVRAKSAARHGYPEELFARRSPRMVVKWAGSHYELIVQHIVAR